MKRILNVSEMKQVRGGAVPSDYCNPGDVLFTCATGYNSGFITKGVACGRNASEVAARMGISKFRVRGYKCKVLVM